MLNYQRVMILMHLLTLSIESRHLFTLFTMLRWTTPQTDGCNNVTNDLPEVRPETADCNGCTMENNGGLGYSHFRTPGNLQAPRKIPAPTWSKIQTCGFVRKWGMPQNSPYINGKIIINHWLDFEVPSFQTNHDKPMFEKIFSLWMDSLATCFFSLG